jgi:hypothetical protein
VKADPYERFMSYVDTGGGPDTCWSWTGGRATGGYGNFWAGGSQVLAHRWLLSFLRGQPICPGEVVCHRCDNPPCVNPAHLYVGDHFTNMQDMVERGRHGSAVKTHCPEGHAYDEANTYTDKRGYRHCRTCRRDRERVRYRRLRRLESELVS